MRIGRVFRRISVVALCAVVVLAGGAYALWSYVFSGLDYRPSVDPTATPEGAGGTSPTGPEATPEATAEPSREAPHMDEVLNILLIGTDNRNPDDLRGMSDVLMVMTVDRRHGSLKLMSIMRDLWVPIPGHGNRKINEACAFGGPELAMRTVNANFGLDIVEYAVVDFLGAEKIIDAAGGVMIDVLPAQLKYLNGQLYEENYLIFPDTPPVPYIEKAGLQHLVGRQAVAYARIRKMDSDFKRTERQRNVLKALFSSFNDCSLVRRTQIVQQGLSFVTTSLSPAEITWLALQALPLLDEGVREFRLPTDGDYVVHPTGTWCMVPDRNAMVPKVQAFIWERTYPFDPYPAIRAPASPATPTAAPTTGSDPTADPTADPTPVPATETPAA